MLVGTHSWVPIRRRLWKQCDLLPRTAPTCPCTATGSRHQSVLHFSRLNASHGLRQPISANLPNFRRELRGTGKTGLAAGVTKWVCSAQWFAPESGRKAVAVVLDHSKESAL